MSQKPYEIEEWVKLFLSMPIEKHLDLLLVLGIIYKSSEGEQALRNADLSGDTVILTRLMNNVDSFAEAFEDIDIERLFYTYFSEKQYEVMLLDEWLSDTWINSHLKLHKYINKWIDLFKLFPKSQEFYKYLPTGNFIVYRAGSIDGISWTLNRGIAVWYYNRNKASKSEPKNNRFLSLRISRKDAFLYLNQLGEEEVIIEPKVNNVQIIPYNEHKNFEEVVPKIYNN
mgnify:FL=1